MSFSFLIGDHPVPYVFDSAESALDLFIDKRLNKYITRRNKMIEIYEHKIKIYENKIKFIEERNDIIGPKRNI